MQMWQTQKPNKSVSFEKWSSPERVRYMQKTPIMEMNNLTRQEKKKKKRKGMPRIWYLKYWRINCIALPQIFQLLSEVLTADFVSVNYLSLYLTTVKWQCDAVQNYAANKGMVQFYYGAALDFVFKTLSADFRLCRSPALVEMKGTNALCDLQKESQPAALWECGWQLW